MSKPIAAGEARLAAVAAAPTTPPAGPDRIASLPSNKAASVNAPDDCMKNSLVLASSAPISRATPST